MSGEEDVIRHDLAVVARYLGRLDGLLGAFATFGIDEETALATRLREEMLPLRMQARIAMDFPFRALDQLVPEPGARMPVDMASLRGLRTSLAERVSALEALKAGEILKPCPILSDRAGDSEIRLPASDFLSLYVLPNFFFHLTLVYLTLRLLGVPIGKGDFDGFHLYQPHVRVM